jgi:hypothetical protein
VLFAAASANNVPRIGLSCLLAFIMSLL